MGIQQIEKTVQNRLKTSNRYTKLFSYQVSINNELEQVFLHARLHNRKQSRWFYNQEAVNFSGNERKYKFWSQYLSLELTFLLAPSFLVVEPWVWLLPMCINQDIWHSETYVE